MGEEQAAAIAGNSVPTTSDMFSAFSSLGTTFLNQRFARRMYERQRDDRRADWDALNAYNDPSAMRARLEKAGYNPALMYGQGSAGGGSTPIPTTDLDPVYAREPKFTSGRPDLMAQMLGFADLKIKNAQADNLEAQNDVIRQDAILRAWQAQNAGFDFGFKSDMRDVSADSLREQLRSTKTNTDIAIERNAREAASNASNLQEAAERMLNLAEQRKSMVSTRAYQSVDTDRLRQQISLMKQDGTLKEMDIRLREKGINPSDPLWTRYVGMFLSDIYEGRVTAGDIGTSIWKWIFD